MPWPPRRGDLLPRFDEPAGIEERLREYSLVDDHENGGPKAKGFREMLGIELTDFAYLAQQIREGIASTPISQVRAGRSGDPLCTVQFQIAGRGRYSHRKASLRTGWVLDSPTSRPRMTTAFLRGREHR